MPNHKQYISQGEVRRLFDYREDGVLINRLTRSPRAVKGFVAGGPNKSNGYYRVLINRKTFQLSRLIWIWHYGDIPHQMEIDHIDRNPANNKIENLRPVTKRQNEYNKPRQGCNYENGKWRASIYDHGKNVYLGLYKTKEEAQQAYFEYAAKLHGEYLCA